MISEKSHAPSNSFSHQKILFFSQTNYNATAGKWKLASTEPTQRYMLYFGRQEHPVFSVLMLWMVKQKENNWSDTFLKKNV